MKAYETLSGNTPLIRIDYRLDGRPGAVYAKLESFNLSGSIKDRVAARIVARAEETGALVSGQPIVEVTSGNTGIAFAALGALIGHPVHIFMPERMSRERATVLFARALGIRPSENPDLSGFADGDTAASWSAGYIDAMAKAGIIQGVGNQTLALGANITRGSVVTILDNAVAEYAHEAGASVTGAVDGMLLVAAGDVTVQDAQVSGGVLVAPKAAQSGQKEGGAALHVEHSAFKSGLLVQAHGAALTLDGTQVEGETVLSGDRASLSLEEGTHLSVLAVDGVDGSISVGQNAAVDTLAARQAVKVDNQGTIQTAQVEASGVVLDGNKPGSVTVAGGVTPPTNSEGETVTGSEDSGDKEEIAGIVGVRPVDQDHPEQQLPQVTASAVQEEGFVQVHLSTDEIVPIHQSEHAGKGAWVGVAFRAPEGYEGEEFRYAFGTQPSDTADSTDQLIENPDIGEGKYALFFINASALTPKTHITLQWGEQAQAIRYEVDLSGVKTPVAVLEDVTVSTHQLPAGVESSGTGLAFDESTALVENGGTGTLTQEQVAAMGGGGEYTVYYSVPQALGEGTLRFDKIARSINGGAWNTWSISSQTEAESGSGWWTRDETHYFFKWGAVFAQQAEDLYQMKEGGVFDYTLSFLQSDGTQDNVVATCTFRIDLSGYTISQDQGD